MRRALLVVTIPAGLNPRIVWCRYSSLSTTSPLFIVRAAPPRCPPVLGLSCIDNQLHCSALQTVQMSSLCALDHLLQKTQLMWHTRCQPDPEDRSTSLQEGSARVESRALFSSAQGERPLGQLASALSVTRAGRHSQSKATTCEAARLGFVAVLLGRLRQESAAREATLPHIGC